MAKTTWRKSISECADGDEIIYCTLTDAELDVEFDDGYGTSRGKPFTAWSERYVYFPAVYDGLEWVERVPRNPCAEVPRHVGCQ